MIISEKQVIQLIKCAEGYANTIVQLIASEMTTGNPKELLHSINTLLYQIAEQQSDELKVIE